MPRGGLATPAVVSLLFTDVCPPLVHGVGGHELEEHLDAARLDASVSSSEIRHDLGRSAITPAPYVEHKLALSPDADSVQARFRPSVRRNIQIARRAGLVFRWAEEERDLTEKYYELHLATRRRLGLPVQPHRFFCQLWQRMIDNKLGHVCLVHAGSKAIAGALFLRWKQTLMYKFGASDARFWSLRANNLLFAETITWVCENGVEHFHFGRGELEATSLHCFKLGRGAQQSSLRYTMLASATPRVTALPMFARNAFRHSPRWVTRAVGEALYRYTA